MEKPDFYEEIKDYCLRYHPFIAEDEEELTARAHMAQDTFDRCKENGMNYDYAKHEANLVLYDGLNFSLYEMIEDIIDEKHLNLTGLDKMAREMCILLKPIVDKYEINDDFGGTVEYDYLRKELDEHITAYIKKTELDRFI